MRRVNNVLMALPNEEVFGVRRRVTSRTTNLMHVNLKVGKHKVPALHDSGATASLINLEAVRRLGLTHMVQKSDHSLSGAFVGPAESSYGEITLTFYIKRKPYRHSLICANLNPGTDIILGQDFWRSHNSLYMNKDGEARLYLRGDLVYTSLTPRELASRQAQEGQGVSDQKAAIFKTHVIPSRGEHVVKLRLPEDVPRGGKVMIEALPGNKLQFINQITLVREAQWGTQHDPTNCAGHRVDCTGCTPYKFAYIVAKNTAGTPLKLKPNHPLALVSSCERIKKSKVVHDLKVAYAHAIHTAGADRPDYKDPQRIARAISLLGGKCPDAPAQQKFVEALLSEYPQTVHLEGEPLSVTDAVKHHILYEGPAIWRRQRPICRDKLEGLHKTVQQLVKEGSIRASDSPFNFQTVPVWKAAKENEEREIRLCVDLSPLNKLTPRDRVSVPSWDDHVSRLYGSKVFSKIDLKSSFHQIALSEESQRKTAFSVGASRWQYCRVPMGLSCAPASLIRLMNMVFSHCSSFILSYMDDFIIHSVDEETHKLHLRQVFQCLAQAKLQISLEKSSFFVRSVSFLGFILSHNKVQPDPKKVRALLNAEGKPSNLFDVRSVLGKFNMYRRYIPRYAQIVAPIVALTSGHPVGAGKSIKVEWTEVHDSALKKLKEQTIKHAVLTHPNFEEPFYIYADASKKAIGGVIMQEDPKDPKVLRPISFYSKLLSPAERNYSTIDREAMAIFSVLETNKCWLQGQRINIYSDHRPLKYILTSDADAGRLVRWRFLLQEFQPTLHYVPGEENHAADFMSRFSAGDTVTQGYHMKNNFMMAQEHGSLPRGIPETFTPPQSHIGKGARGSLKGLDGPLVVLGDTHACRPTGHLAAIADQLPYVKQYYENRVPEAPGAAFCTEETSAKLGSIVTLKDPRKQGPDVYMCMSTYHTAYQSNNAEEIGKLRATASAALMAHLNNHNSSERVFYAQLAFETLMDKWAATTPAEKVHIVAYAPASDRGCMKLVYLFRQVAYACMKVNIQPHILTGPGFRSHDLVMNPKDQEVINLMWKPVQHISSVLADAGLPWDNELILRAQGEDPFCQALTRRARNQDPLEGDEELLSDLKPVSDLKKDPFVILDNKLLYLKDARKRSRECIYRIVVPEALRRLALQYAHNRVSAHMSIVKTSFAATRLFFWPGMDLDIIKYCNHCAICLGSKPEGRDAVPYGSTYLPLMPFDCLIIDVVTPGAATTGGHKHVLVAVDAVSRYGFFIPVKNHQAKHLADMMHKFIFNHFGKCRYLHSDQAGEFRSADWSAFLKAAGIRQHMGTPYSPRSQGHVERLNKTLLQLLRSVMIEYPSQWDHLLPFVQAAYNGALHSALGDTPHYLMFGRDANLDLASLHPEGPYDDSDSGRRCQIYAKCLTMARSAIFQTQETRRKRLNMARPPIADIGDVVYVRKHYQNEPSYKILPRFIGPFRIVTLKGQVALLRAFSSGKYCKVHLRNAKLIPHAALTKTENPNVNEPFATRGYSMLPPGKGVKYIKKHEELTKQDKADLEMPGSIRQPLVPDLRPEVLAELEDPVPSLRERDTTVSWREEEDLVGGVEQPAQPSVSQRDSPAQPSGKPARKCGRPPGSKNKKWPEPPSAVRLELESSDEAEEGGAPVARRTRSRDKTQQVSMVSHEPDEDPYYGIWLEF